MGSALRKRQDLQDGKAFDAGLVLFGLEVFEFEKDSAVCHRAASGRGYDVTSHAAYHWVVPR